MWAMNRFLTKLRHPPKYRFGSLLAIMFPPALWGFTLASVPFWIMVGICWIWFYTLASKSPGLHPNSLNFEGWTPSWSFGVSWTDSDQITAKRGRFGIAMLALSLYGMSQTIKMLIPDTLNPHYEDDINAESAEAFDQVRAAVPVVSVCCCASGYVCNLLVICLSSLADFTQTNCVCVGGAGCAGER